MKNRIIKTVLCATLAAALLLSLAACSSEGETTPVGHVAASTVQQESESQQTTQSSMETEAAPADDEAASDTQEESVSQPEAQSDAAAAAIEETVMWDDDCIKVAALSLTSDQYYHILNLQIENKTGSELYVMASRTAVNSFVVEPTMGVRVPANSTADGAFKVSLNDVAADVIADIETRFSYDSSDNSVSRKTERVKLETSAAASFDYSYDESGTVLHDADGIKIICKGFNDEGNPMIYVSSTGELSEGCCVEEDEIYINDKLTFSDYYAWVFTNTRNLMELELEDEDRDGNALGEVESLKMSFKISRENLADPDPVKTELVEIPVK